MIVITPDDHHIRAFNSTAFIYTDEMKPITFIPKNEDLFCVDVADRPAFRPFGICSDDSFIYIASHRNIAKYDKKTFTFICILDVELFPNTHQLHSANGVIYAASTSVNAISFITGSDVKHYSTTEKKFIDILQPETSDNIDISHINSVYATNTHLYYCLHNLRQKLSEIRKIDLSTMEDISLFSYGLCNHGVIPLDNKVVTLSSGTGELVIFDELTNKVLAVDLGIDPKVSFLRGLDKKDGIIYFISSNNFSADQDVYNCKVYKYDIYTNNVESTANIYDMLTVADMRFV